MPELNIELEDQQSDEDFVAGLVQVGVTLELAQRALRLRYAAKETQEIKSFIEQLPDLGVEANAALAKVQSEFEQIAQAEDDTPFDSPDLYIPGKSAICDICKVVFYPKKKWGKYCSSKCRNLAYWARRGARS